MNILNRTRSIKLKATFLLIVFSLNTVVGFACSLGLNMGFNSKHHGDNKATEAVVHIYKGSKNPIHQQKKECHNRDKSDKHDEGSSTEKSNRDDGNCCSNKIKGFHNLYKPVPASSGILHPVFFPAFVAVYNNISLLPHTGIVRDIKRFVRSYHPPIPDIRIAIQSFQI